MFAAVYLHRLDPYAIRLWGDLGIRWYGLSYVAGFVLAGLLIWWLARRRRTPLEPGYVSDFVLTVAIGTVVGGRLGYCVFYRPDLLVDFSGSIPFWGVLAINEGGMASHGGMLGILFACLYYAYRHSLPALHLFDLVALTATIGVFFGRIANFINGELLGRRCSPNLPWAVKFPQEIRGWLRPDSPMHEKLSSPQFQQVEQMVREMTGPSSAPIYERIIAKAQSSDRVAEALRPLLTPRHPSQLYEALLEGLVLFVLLGAIWWRPRRPGVVSGWFLVGYAVVRLIGEQFRTPDAHIGYELFGMTRGQELSVLMLLIGVGCLIWWARRPVSKLGGWGPAGAAGNNPDASASG